MGTKHQIYSTKSKVLKPFKCKSILQTATDHSIHYITFPLPAKLGFTINPCFSQDYNSARLDLSPFTSVCSVLMQHLTLALKGG